MGLLGLVHPDGEVALARAMHAVGSVYTVSAMASYALEEVAERAPGPLWFQLYVWRDRGLTRDLADRARAAGYGALVLTVDVPWAAGRDRDRRNGFGIPPRATARSLAGGAIRPRWAYGFARHARMTAANVQERGSDAISITQYVNSQFDPSLGWDDLAWFRDIWDGPLAVKGILRPEDARRATDLGADAVIVSNHGGRQLDGAVSGIAALPGVVDAVGGDGEVLLDGGVRRGSDILKAVAEGARACLVGRPLVYGLGVAGEAGATRAAEILRGELRTAMGLSGCPSLGAADRSLLRRRGPAAIPASLEEAT
jgi:L-lactate dehydrogenase (cytochrome)